MPSPRGSINRRINKMTERKDLLTLQIEGANLVRHYRPAVLIDNDGQLWLEEKEKTNVCHPIEVEDLKDTLDAIPRPRKAQR